MSDEYITDGTGKPIGRIRRDGKKTYVFDKIGRPLGTSSEHGTFDKTGKPVSQQDVPDLLLGLIDEEDDD